MTIYFLKAKYFALYIKTHGVTLRRNGGEYRSVYALQLPPPSNRLHAQLHSVFT